MSALLLSNFPQAPSLSCNSNSLQPLAVRSHQLLCLQPNDSGKRNTAKSCTEFSQFICSAYIFWMAACCQARLLVQFQAVVLLELTLPGEMGTLILCPGMRQNF